MNIEYVNSSNKKVDLNSEPYKMLISDLLDYDWEMVESGNKIAGFKKGISKRSIDIDVIGTKGKSSRKLANDLTDIFEEDVQRGIPGKLFVGEYYLTCYIVSCEKTNWTTDVILSCEYGVVTDHPYWVREHRYSFRKNETDPEGAKRYANRYPYRYANGLINSRIVNDHYADSNFLLTIYGPIVDPVLYIGGHEYSVKIVLEEGEYLEIDSAAGTVVKVKASGERVNAFHNRSFEISVFEPIHPGGQDIGWSGRFAFDLVIFEERSVARWR